MAEYKVKRKNTSIQVISIKDSEGTLVTDLSTAAEIKFVVKQKRDGDKLIEKTKGDGIEVLSGDDLGKLKITLTPADTDLEQGSYLMALQIKYSETKIYEVNLKSEGVGTESFRVVADLIS